VLATMIFCVNALVFDNISQDINDYLNHKYLNKKEYTDQNEETTAFIAFLRSRKPSTINE
jgi:hypothetical protein